MWARTVKELRAKVGGGSVSKQYTDRHYTDDGSRKTVHNGYVIGGLRGRWFTAFRPIEIEA
jgi:hypothetical protein